ncbi:hypothetical protein [Stutzerimonas nitrititolerans]|uniref:hypothetical protein n=1 Tax=Stutzerimonas nitrititolerans TaxID=2482751 RepID=UPI0028A10D6A|nr:hypothetical protein [Stutzerimonas nitrititolerans]
MKLHDTWSDNGMKILEVAGHDGVQEFQLVHSFDFGLLPLFDVDCTSAKNAVDETKQFHDGLSLDQQCTVECAEALYVLFEEAGAQGTEEMLCKLSDFAASRGYVLWGEIYEEQALISDKSLRIFKLSEEEFCFEIDVHGSRVKYTLSVDSAEDCKIEPDCGVIGWLNEFSLGNLRQIYAEDPGKNHLEQYVDRSFSGDLGL